MSQPPRWTDPAHYLDNKYARLWIEERKSTKDGVAQAAANHGHNNVSVAQSRAKAFLLHEKVRGSLEEQEGSRLRRYRLRTMFNIEPVFRPEVSHSKRPPLVLSGRRISFSVDGIYGEYVFDDDECLPIIERALSGSRVDIQVVDEVIEEFMSHGKPLTLALSRYVNERLRRLREMEPRKRGRPQVTEQRDIMIAYSVYDIHKVYGFSLSPSAETKDEPAPSAPEIVADALLACDIKLTPDAVYRIWSKYSEVGAMWQEGTKFDLVGSSGGKELWGANNPRQWK